MTDDSAPTKSDSGSKTPEETASSSGESRTAIGLDQLLKVLRENPEAGEGIKMTSFRMNGKEYLPSAIAAAQSKTTTPSEPSKSPQAESSPERRGPNGLPAKTISMEQLLEMSNQGLLKKVELTLNGQVTWSSDEPEQSDAELQRRVSSALWNSPSTKTNSSAQASEAPRSTEPSPEDVSLEALRDLIAKHGKGKFLSFTLAGKTYTRKADGKITPDD